MIFRNLDLNHDWTYGAGLANYINGDAAIGLNIETRIMSWVGDCFFNTQTGIDWVNRLGSKNQRALLEADLRRIILQSFGVTGINSISTVLTDRSFLATYSVSTIFSASYVNTINQEFGNA